MKTLKNRLRSWLNSLWAPPTEGFEPDGREQRRNGKDVFLTCSVGEHTCADGKKVWYLELKQEGTGKLTFLHITDDHTKVLRTYGRLTMPPLPDDEWDWGVWEKGYNDRRSKAQRKADKK